MWKYDPVFLWIINENTLNLVISMCPIIAFIISTANCKFSMFLIDYNKKKIRTIYFFWVQPHLYYSSNCSCCFPSCWNSELKKLYFFQKKAFATQFDNLYFYALNPSFSFPIYLWYQLFQGKPKKKCLSRRKVARGLEKIIEKFTSNSFNSFLINSWKISSIFDLEFSF